MAPLSKTLLLLLRLSLSASRWVHLGNNDKTLNFIIHLSFTWTKTWIELLNLFIFKFGLSYIELVIIYLLYSFIFTCCTSLCLKLLFMVLWWCIFCKRYCAWSWLCYGAHTGTTGFAFVLGDLYCSSPSRRGLARGVSRDGHVLTLILMDWPIISPKPSANWTVLIVYSWNILQISINKLLEKRDKDHFLWFTKRSLQSSHIRRDP